MNHFVIADTFSWLLAHAGSALPVFRSFAQTAAPAAVAALWQGAAVAAGLAICLRFAPRISAAHRFAVWTASFAVLVGLQLWPFLAHFTSEPASGAVAAFAESSYHPWLQVSAGWSVAIAAAWLVLAVVRAGDLLLHSIRLRRLWKSASPIEGSEQEALATAPGSRGVQVCATRQLDRPSVIGFLAPRILIPDWLYARLSPEELGQVVLHEAEHLRRRDDWTNLLQKLCLVLFPLNPALAWIERRLCREREMACDEGVVRVTRAPRAYAACLASLAERRLQRRAEMFSFGTLSLGAFERRPELVQRVHSILLRRSVLNPLGSMTLIAAVGCGLIVGSVELARCPQVVAFVPAHRQVAALPQIAQADFAQGASAAYLPARGMAAARLESRFRATNVEAVFPETAARDRMRTPTMERSLVQRTSEARSGARVSANPASNEPRQRLLKAQMPQRRTNPAEKAQAEEWVVFTAWQMQTPTQQTGTTADYDVDAKPDGLADETSSQPAAPASQIAVTRLILKVYPADSAAGSAANQQTPASRPNVRANSKPILSRPTLLPFGGGWLVIQL